MQQLGFDPRPFLGARERAHVTALEALKASTASVERGLTRRELALQGSRSSGHDEAVASARTPQFSRTRAFDWRGLGQIETRPPRPRGQDLNALDSRVRAAIQNRNKRNERSQNRPQIAPENRRPLYITRHTLIVFLRSGN